MTVVGPLRLAAGVHTSAVDASPEHCTSDTLNFVSDGGAVRVRGGMRHKLAVTGSSATPYMGWGNGVAEPAAVANAGNLQPASSATTTTLYVGHSATFNQVYVHGSAYGAPAAWSSVRFQVIEYWDGAAWTALSCGDLFTPWYSSATAECNLGGFCRSPNAAGIEYGEQSKLQFTPPSDWATKTIATQTLYWLRIRILPATTGHRVQPANSRVQTTENRVLDVLTFRDRNGARHELVTYLFGETGTDLRFLYDGVVMTMSAGLTPDGSAVVYDENTQVEAFYHAPTNRVIGVISGYAWFYCLASADSAGANTMYVFIPDSTASDTPYQSVSGGLRSGIPAAAVVAMYDSRIFLAEGQLVMWSAPGPYADVWPNANEAYIADDGGNITGLAQIGGNLVVLKRNSIWVGQASGEGDSYIFYPLPGNVGCVARRSIVAVGNTLVFLGEDGFYRFTGETVERLSGALDGLVATKSFMSRAANGFGVYASEKGQYRFFFPSGAQSTVCDEALYCDMAGHEVSVRGRTTRDVSWWRQGKYNTTDYGFNATCVVADSTTDVNEVLLGDRYGVVWTMDHGRYDGATAVQATLETHRIGLGSSQRATVRWVNPAQKVDGDFQWTIKVTPEGTVGATRTITIDPFVVRPSGHTVIATEGDPVATGETVSEPQGYFLHQGSMGIACRWFQLEFLVPAGYPLEVDMVEIEVSPLGRRRQG